jgi:hypothetical protein
MPNITDIIELLPREPKSRYWRARPLGNITRIVVHYDAVRVPKEDYDPVARYVAQAQYHMKRNWNENGGPAVYGFGLMYQDVFNPTYRSVTRAVPNRDTTPNSVQMRRIA